MEEKSVGREIVKCRTVDRIAYIVSRENIARIFPQGYEGVREKRDKKIIIAYNLIIFSYELKSRNSLRSRDG